MAVLDGRWHCRCVLHGKVFYMLYRFIRYGVFSGVVDITRESVTGLRRWATIVRVLMPATFAPRDSASSVFWWTRRSYPRSGQ